ncbi:hypothetical protein DPMN_032871 [Dreissena polymorpha]|uniref:Uncharacterized protein n=1 Tax=Dreissena polymorpha TaxID=45954 RepID=A0A9D4RID4_DREPO|nr:hypothetical protein DPMN_032871 [Dreissena polymorpha]
MTKVSSELKSDTNPKYSVQQDYTNRVKRHRRILGERMVRERNNGHYTSIRYDKLFVNDTIYRYDDNTDQIVYVRKRSRPRAFPQQGGEKNAPMMSSDWSDLNARTMNTMTTGHMVTLSQSMELRQITKRTGIPMTLSPNTD